MHGLRILKKINKPKLVHVGYGRYIEIPKVKWYEKPVILFKQLIWILRGGN